MVYKSLGSRVSDSVAKQNLALATVYALMVPLLHKMWPWVWEKLLGGDPEARVRKGVGKFAACWALFVVTGEFSAIQYIKWHGRPEA
mmetsp:Transcript_8253/g.18451  ORF Transcript_8253/g.18451 Transcript_8253/m.18451 type:complete len:87 (+) Transcript_8253:105-365(+)